MKVAIVSTLRNAGTVLPSFIHYHERIGIDHFYFFLDAPDTAEIQSVIKKKNITVIKNDRNLEEKWKRTRRYSVLKEFLTTETGLNQDRILARQELNVEVAISLALKESVDWLIHIDLDELFFIPSNSVQEHFRFLERKKIEYVTYRNYEAVPEEFEIRDYFKMVTLFKRNSAHLDNSQLYLVERDGLLFTSYGNGKSAAKIKKGLLPLGVHEFDIRKRVLLREKEKRNTSKGIITMFPIILHYPNCGFENFWKKYRILGHFRDKWYGRMAISRSLPFHLQARDVVMLNDRRVAMEFYRKRIMIKGKTLIDRWIRRGVLCRIKGPSEIIKDLNIRGL